MDNAVTIIGGGISGLTTAFYLKELGIRSTIVEKADRVGGLIQTQELEGCDLEAGPDSFIASKPAAQRLAEQLGIVDQIIGTNDQQRRTYIVRDQKLVPIPRGMVMMVPGDWKAAIRSPLFSVGSKARLILENFKRPKERSGDFSIREFVLDHFGEQALSYVTEPLLSGVYGGHAEHLSAASVLPRFVEYERRFGSLTKGLRNEPKPSNSCKSLFLSFRRGMGSLVARLAGELQGFAEVEKGEAKAVAPNDNGWSVSLTDGRRLQSRAFVLACPAHVSATLLLASYPRLSTELAAIPYSSAILVTLLFEKSSFRHALNGFGFLVPRSERETIAAATWINTKFPSRVAPGTVAIRTFIVDPEASRVKNTPTEELVKKCVDDLKKLMNLQQGPVRSLVNRWPNSMPQYVVGHGARVERIKDLARSVPGLYLASNYFDGVGIPDCIRQSDEIARQITKSLHR